MKSFKFPRKYYLDRQIYKRGSVDIETGPTVLIGCNGSGKTTMIHIIKEKLESEEIPLIFFDNLSDGGSTSLNKALFHNRMEMLASMAISSEGELININLANQMKEMFLFIETGMTKKIERDIAWKKAFHPEKYVEKEIPNERWILFDAVDSGFSIDNIMDFKEYMLFPLMEKAKKLNIDLYFIISANEYEMTSDLPCLNVQDCKYVKINSYEDYKKQIIRSRNYKDKTVDEYESELKEDE